MKKCKYYDIVLISNSNSKLQKMFNIVTTYFNYFGLDLSMNENDKTAYISNKKHVNKTLKHNKTNIPWLNAFKSYKYLGVYINLNLEWKQQIKVSNFRYFKHIAYLRKKCFNATQTAEILNLVVFPTITYRMRVYNILSGL
jgi:hypothetical protein